MANKYIQTLGTIKNLQFRSNGASKMTKNQNGCGQGVRQMISNKIVCVSAFKLIALLATLWVQTVAAMTEAEMQAELNADGSFIRATGTAYQFQGAPHVGVPLQQPSQTVESLHARLLAGKPSSLASTQTTTWIPIAGDITIFVPRHQTVYPLQKRIGDALVQSRLIRTQVQYKLGRHLISGVYQTEAQQISQLYDNAYALANTAGFLKKFGDSLTPSDLNVAALDVIWPELRTINGESVLVPVLHLTAATLGDHSVTGHTVEFQGGDALFKNIEIVSGSITTRRNTVLAAAQNFVVGEGASVTSTGDLNLAVGGTLLSYGTITAGQTINITAGNYHQKTLVHRFKTEYGYNDRLGLISSVNVGDSIVVKSHGDITILGAEMQAGADIVFDAQGNIRIGTVALASGKEVITRRTQYHYSALEHVQSTLSAGDNIKMMAAGLIEIDAANLHANRGHIELLAGMGVSVLDELNQEQSSFHGKWRKLTVDESAYVTVAMRAVLDAGKGIKIHSEIGDITLRATDMSSEEGASLSATGGKVNLLMSTVTDQYNYQSVRERTFTIKTKNYGHNITTGVPNTIVGGLAVEAVAGLNVEYTGDRNKSIEQQIDELKVMPGMEWISELQQDTTLNVDWALVEEQYETWNKTSTTLSPAAIAIISIVVACVAGPGAAALGELAGGVAVGAASSAISAAVTAGVTSMAVQAAVITSNAFVNGEYDLYEIQKDINSKETMTTVATAMVTAAALSYLDSTFFEDVDVDALAREQGVDPSTIDTGLLRDAKGKLNFIGQAAQVTSNAAASSFIEVLAQGDSLSEFGGDFHNAFEGNLKRAAIDRLGEETYQGIAGAQFNTAIEYIALAGAGCVFGAAVGEGANDRGDCYSGAGGAVIGKYLGDKTSEDAATPEQLQAMQMQQREWLSANGVSSAAEWVALQNADPASYLKLSKDFNKYRLSSVRSLHQGGVDIARMTAGLLALVAGGNVDVAANQASVSAANSAKLSQKLAVLNAIDVLSDYQNLEPLLDLQELLAGANSAEELAQVFEILVQQYPEYGFLLSLPATEALAKMQQNALDSGYAQEFSQLLAASLSGRFSVATAAHTDELVGDFLNIAAPDRTGYWALKAMSMGVDQSVIEDIAAKIDDQFAIRFRISSCSNIGACVEASDLMKALLLLSDASDLQSAAQRYYDQNRPLIASSGDPDLIYAFDATFAYFSSASELVVEAGIGYAELVEMGSAQLAVLTGMAAYVATDGKYGQVEYVRGIETVLQLTQTTAYLISNYESLPNAVKQSVDDYFEKIDAAEAAGDVLEAEKLKSKPFLLVASMAITGGRGVGQFVPGGPLLRNAKWFDAVALSATRNPDSSKLVLGHFAQDGTSYQKVAAHYDATYFKVDDWKSVTNGLSQDEIWRINETFLDQQILQGKQIIFSHNPLEAKPNSFFEKEVVYLRNLGYTFRKKDQWTWEAVLDEQ